MSRRKRTNKMQIVFRNGATRVVYVSRAPDELFDEASRIHTCSLSALRQLRLLKRTRHAAVKAAVWQLEQLAEPNPKWSTAALVDYIASASFLMEDTLGILSALKNSNIDELRAARFQLTYGQTPKKRDRDDTMCTRSRRSIDEEDEVPEDGG